jgi:uncharacterized protein involved in type VI secretion and phage assembly
VVTATHPHSDADDDNNYEVSVRVKHSDLELRRVPLATDSIGLVAAPAVGDLVLVQFVDADVNLPVVLGRFYSDAARPPRHDDGEVVLEQRLDDGTRNQLTFHADGSVSLRRDVADDDGDAAAALTLSGSGDLTLAAGSAIRVRLVNDDSMELVADGKKVTVTCDALQVTGDVQVDGDLTVGSAANSTKISGNTITGTGA